VFSCLNSDCVLYHFSCWLVAALIHNVMPVVESDTRIKKVDEIIKSLLINHLIESVLLRMYL
jgi:hypothetical protein